MTRSWAHTPSHHCDVVFELWLLQIHSICSSASSQGCRKTESAKLIEMKVLLLQSPLVVAACDNISLCRWLHHLPASHPVTCHVSHLHTRVTINISSQLPPAPPILDSHGAHNKLIGYSEWTELQCDDNITLAVFSFFLSPSYLFSEHIIPTGLSSSQTVGRSVRTCVL